MRFQAGIKILCILSLFGAAAVAQSSSEPVRPQSASGGDSPEEQMLKLLREDHPYIYIRPNLFEQLGWDLPDGGASVKSLADAAPGGAFDPRKLENLPLAKLGYRAKWHEVRYKYYGLDWEIGGLHLMPEHPVPGLPTMAFVHGAFANWYEFFIDPLNGPGLGQYLAQKVPVLLVTIPGNYKHGGWTEPPGERAPAYLLHQNLSPEETRVRTAVYTFKLVTEGVRLLIEKASSGPVVAIGHSTGGKVPFLLRETSLKPRLGGLSMAWESGGPAMLRSTKPRIYCGKQGGEWAAELSPEERFKDCRLDTAGPNSPENDLNRGYVGPLNPVKGSSLEEVGRRWFQLEQRRRAMFIQFLQHLEREGDVELRPRVGKELRDTLGGNNLGLKPEEVMSDLFSTMRVSLTGYKKMVWVVDRDDNNLWDTTNAEQSSVVQIAKEFRKQNPTTPVRVAVFDMPMTHYGHVEKPRQVAGGLIAALRWLLEP